MIVIGSAFLMLLSKVVWKPYVAKSERYISDLELKKSILQINDDLPFMVDDITRLDNVNVVKRNVIYSYTFLNSVELKSGTPISMEELKNIQLNEYCFGTEENRYFSTVNVSITSIYKYEIGDKIESFTIKPSECREANKPIKSDA